MCRTGVTNFAFWAFILFCGSERINVFPTHLLNFQNRKTDKQKNSRTEEVARSLKLTLLRAPQALLKL